jgi:hypothetical protein
LFAKRQEEARTRRGQKAGIGGVGQTKGAIGVAEQEIEFLAATRNKINLRRARAVSTTVVSISKENPGALKMSFVFEKKSTADTGKSNATQQSPRRLCRANFKTLRLSPGRISRQGKYRDSGEAVSDSSGEKSQQPRRIIQSWRGLLS